MEFLNSKTSFTQISPAIPFLKWKRRKSPSGLTIPNSIKVPLRRSFSLYPFHAIRAREFQISCHFGRPTNRQNYLRKKLTQQQQSQQFQQVSQLQIPIDEFDKVDGRESDFDSSGEKRKHLEISSIDNNSGDSDGVRESEEELRKKKFGESIMWNKLESWVDQYKKDSEFWGIGNGPIFTIHQDSEGKVERVVVNEDEILRRSRVNPRIDNETEDLDEVNFRISFAKDLATEMENGSNVIPKNSSVAEFLVSGGESRFTEAIQGVALKPGLVSRMWRAGVLILCGLSVVWAIRGLFTVGEDSKEYTRLDKEMLRRKMKARAETEKKVKGSVEMMQEGITPRSMSFRRPQLDKEELVSSIVEAKGSNSELKMVEYTANQNEEFKDKIEEIRAMAKHARETERRDSLNDERDGEDYQALKEFSSFSSSLKNDRPIPNEAYGNQSDKSTESMASTDPKYDIGQSTDGTSNEENETESYGIPTDVISSSAESSRPEVSNMKRVLNSSEEKDANSHFGGPGCLSHPHENSYQNKFRIIKSAEQAREYLSRKHPKLEVHQTHEVRNDEQMDIAITTASTNTASGSTNKIQLLTDEVYDASFVRGIHHFSHVPEDNDMGSETTEENVDLLKCGHEVIVSRNDARISALEIRGERENDIKTTQSSNCINEISTFPGSTPASTSTEVDSAGLIQTEEVPTPLKRNNSGDTGKNETSIGPEVLGTSNANEVKDRNAELTPSVKKKNWIEKNFHEFEPIVRKIGVGFRNNYLVARERASEELDSTAKVDELKSDVTENELEWMKDERLREVVFKVRDNELSGRDPFHLMGEEDKHIFFSGLEEKVEQENEKLLNLHEYFHSNIENLDYGADGISLYDPPEKIIPRWKVPPAEKNPEFLNNFVEQRKELVAESLKNSLLSKKTGKDIIHKLEEPSSHKSILAAGDVSDKNTELQKDTLASSKTIIEGSDGSVRKGNKSGREYWQHTKKWSQGFLESYNAETDPEVKAVMRDMGKDLDRWITEKEIQEAADLMDKLPEKGQNFIKQKLDKVKREMELFGPQAVVSKYREYAEEKEEDYLWWLDLPFVLCIELYTVKNGEQRVGFYSLEMAADLELDPKQYHVIAFEDASDCKNLCYIIQAHMEMLGNGNAFVVARPPKDAFREAKANGFSVTVIRKDQLQLNIDHTLEEVEESIVEIGSKIYHDKITKERGVDINALMKGVFGISKPAKRKRSKQKLKRRIKP